MHITFATVEDFRAFLGLPPLPHDAHVRRWELEQKLATFADASAAVMAEVERINAAYRARNATSDALAEVRAYMAKPRHLRSVA